MKKNNLLITILFLFSLISGCSFLYEEDPFEGITVEPTTSVYETGGNYALNYVFVITNNTPKDFLFNIEITPENEEIKKLLGTQKITQKNGLNETSNFNSQAASTISVGETFLIPKKDYEKEEILKMIKTFSYSLSNEEYKKIFK